ncbi:MAG TPA: hypothetical protein VF156_15475 [Agromyces sp.]
MITISGEGCWSDQPDTAPSLFAIGVGLGRLPRWAGQTRDEYSVLAHSIVVAELLPPHLRVHGLLHDAPEIVVGDCMATWKTDADRQREAVILARIYAKLGLDMPTMIERDLVKQADMDARYAEAWELGFANGDVDALERWFALPDEDTIDAGAVERARRLTCREAKWLEAYRQPSTAGTRFAGAVGLWLAVARGEVDPIPSEV